MFCIDFGDFPNNPLSFVFNSLWQKTFFSVFDFLGATGLEKGQAQRAQLGFRDEQNELKWDTRR
jgi:hypothetical protein